MKSEIVVVVCVLVIGATLLALAPSPGDPGVKEGLTLVNLSNSEGFESLDYDEIRIIATQKLINSPLSERQREEMVNGFLTHVRKSREARNIAGRNF